MARAFRTIAGYGALVGAAGMTPAAAQAPVVANPVVQALPSGNSQALNSALARIARNPRDTTALLDAGTAALAMGDAEAAIGFFTRADQVEPGNPRAKAGLAGAYVRNEDPFTAIRLFSEAENSGPLSSALLADRGLAYDLVGDNATAQRYYRTAGPSNDEALRRLSLSLAIAGDKRGSEAALAPLLTRQDRSAWRVRAFALAILGETAQAVSIANAMMPAGMAAAISPYLRYMRQLTPAQQAAAANLGHFPRASEIGRDDPRIAQYAPPVARPAATGADAGLVPAGEPLGSRSRDTQRVAARQDRQDRQRDRKGGRERERPPEPIVGVSTSSSPTLITGTTAPLSPAAASRQPSASVAPSRAPVPVAARPAPPAPAATATPAQALTAGTQARVGLVGPPAPVKSATVAEQASVAGPSFSLLPGASEAAATASKVAANAAAPNSSTPAPSPPKPVRVADAFSDLGRPTVSTVPAPGAVDVRRLAAARPAEAAKPAKPAAPAQPSRIWVQVATGRDKQALAFDWRKLAREEATVLRGKKPYLAAWGQTNRLLTGPFETEASANAFLAQLRRADVEGAFLWTSPAGQVVDAVPGIKPVEVSRGEAEPATSRRTRGRSEAEPAPVRRTKSRR